MELFIHILSGIGLLTIIRWVDNLFHPKVLISSTKIYELVSKRELTAEEGAEILMKCKNNF